MVDKQLKRLGALRRITQGLKSANSVEAQLVSHSLRPAPQRSKAVFLPADLILSRRDHTPSLIRAFAILPDVQQRAAC